MFMPNEEKGNNNKGMKKKMYKEKPLAHKYN